MRTILARRIGARKRKPPTRQRFGPLTEDRQIAAIPEHAATPPSGHLFDDAKALKVNQGCIDANRGYGQSTREDPPWEYCTAKVCAEIEQRENFIIKELERRKEHGDRIAPALSM